MKKFFVAATALLALTSVSLAQEGPAAPARRQGGGQSTRAPRVVVCPMEGKEIKSPSKALKSSFNGRDVSLCCEDCKGAFEKLDEAGKEKAVKKGTLMSRKISLTRQLEQIEKDLKELMGEEKKDGGTTVATKLYCAITDEEIESADKAAGKITYNGKTYYFCCGGCVKKFDSDKARYARIADEVAAKRQ